MKASIETGIDPEGMFATIPELTNEVEEQEEEEEEEEDESEKEIEVEVSDHVIWLYVTRVQTNDEMCNKLVSWATRLGDTSGGARS